MRIGEAVKGHRVFADDEVGVEGDLGVDLSLCDSGGGDEDLVAYAVDINDEVIEAAVEGSSVEASDHRCAEWRKEEGGKRTETEGFIGGVR
jgi:hypothetical protein